VTSRRGALRALLAVLLAACDSTIARLRGQKLVRVTSVDSVPPGGAFRLTLPAANDSTDSYGRPIIVVNDGGTIRAFRAVCTHEGCPLGWNSTQHLIRCPCHGSAFDSKGQVVHGPAALPLTPIETFVERGNVLIVDRGG
jgi:Rieske Fe-S protein